jgi:hypothetical protein
MLGTLAVMLLGSAMAATASAEAGPFWHHRLNSKEGEVGSRIEPNAPENFSGTGGEQVLHGEITEAEGKKTAIEITSPSVQVKGAIFDAATQGQIKLELIYNQPELKKPALKPCSVTVGTKNIVVVKGHLMWKWNGTSNQLKIQPQQPEQTPDLVFTAVEPQQQKPFVEKVNLTNNGTFTNVTLSGGGCGGLIGTFPVSGSEVGIPSPGNVGEWSKKLAVRTLSSENGTFLQHYWDGEGFQGALVGLSFDKNPASLVGQTEVTAAQQEVAVSEK